MRRACLLIGVFTVGCAPPLTAAVLRPADISAMVDAQRLAMVSMQARMNAESSCAPMLTRQVSWEEERYVGHELAVRYSAQAGHFFLDGAVEKDPLKLDQARATATLPEGGRNAVSAHVAVVGRNLAHFSSRPDLPWTFGVIENETPQAFSAPGAYVFVSTGLLKKMTNEAQLAGVLSHEIAHVVQKDMLKTWVASMHKQCIAARYASALIESGAPSSPALAETAKYARRFDPNVAFDDADPQFASFIMQLTMALMRALKSTLNTALKTVSG